MRLQLLHAVMLLTAAARANSALGLGIVGRLAYGLSILACLVMPPLEALIVRMHCSRAALISAWILTYGTQVLGPLIAETLDSTDAPGGVPALPTSSVHLMITTGLYIGAGPVLRVLAFSVTSVEGDALTVAAFFSAIGNAVNIIRLHLGIGSLEGAFFYQGISLIQHLAVVLVAVLVARTLRWAFAVSWRSSPRNSMAVPSVPSWWWPVAVCCGRPLANVCLARRASQPRRGTPYRYVEVERDPSVPVTRCCPLSCDRPAFRIVVREADPSSSVATSPSGAIGPASMAGSRRGSASGSRRSPGSMQRIIGDHIDVIDDDDDDDGVSVGTDDEDAPSGIYFGGITSAWDPAQDRGERDEGSPLFQSRIQRELSGLHLASPAMRISHLLKPLVRSKNRRLATRVSTALNILLSAGNDLHSIGLTEVDKAQASKLARRRADAARPRSGEHAEPGPGARPTVDTSGPKAAAADSLARAAGGDDGDPYRRRLSTSGAAAANSLMMDGDLGRWIRTTLFPQRPAVAGRGGHGSSGASPVAARSLLATRRSMADLRSAARKEVADAAPSNASSLSRSSVVQQAATGIGGHAGMASPPANPPKRGPALIDFGALSRSPLSRPARGSSMPTPGLISRKFEPALLIAAAPQTRNRSTSGPGRSEARSRRRSAVGVLELNATAISGTIRGLRACVSFSHAAKIVLPPRPSTHGGSPSRPGRGKAGHNPAAAAAGPATQMSKSFVRPAPGQLRHRHSTTGARGAVPSRTFAVPAGALGSVVDDALADGIVESDEEDDEDVVAVDETTLETAAALSLRPGRAASPGEAAAAVAAAAESSHAAAAKRRQHRSVARTSAAEDGSNSRFGSASSGSSGGGPFAGPPRRHDASAGASPKQGGTDLAEANRSGASPDRDEDEDDDFDADADEAHDIIEVADLRRVLPSAAGSEGVLMGARGGRTPVFRHNHSGHTLSRISAVSPPEPAHAVLVFPSGLKLPGPAFSSIPHPVGGFSPEDVTTFITDGVAAARIHEAKQRHMRGRNRRASEGKQGSMLAAVSGLVAPTVAVVGKAASDGAGSTETAAASASSTAGSDGPVSPPRQSGASKHQPPGSSERIREEEREDDPEARALANRLLRSLSSERSRTVVKLLTNATDWTFDIFALADATAGRPLAFALSELMTRIGAFAIQGIDHRTFIAYVDCLEREYSFDPTRPNPYHCSTHAADVAQGCGHMLLCEATRPGDPTLDQSDAFSLVLAAAVHDFRHPGVSNLYLQKTAHPLALRYNDDSVLENFHIAEAFTLMRRPHMQVLSGLARDDRDAVRHLMIRCVRATDLSKGGSLVSRFRTEIERMELGGSAAESLDRAVLCEMIIKCADVSHPARPLLIHKRWSDLITSEFYAQGDEEARLAMAKSPLCDRESADLPKGQIGFIQFVVRPALSLLATWLGASHVMEQMDENEAHWRSAAALPQES